MKKFVSMDSFVQAVQDMLVEVHDGVYQKALKMRDSYTNVALDFDEFKKIMKEKEGFIKAMWCGERECEDNVKAETGATTRCIPFEQEHLADHCVYCGHPAKHMVCFAKAYDNLLNNSGPGRLTQSRAINVLFKFLYNLIVSVICGLSSWGYSSVGRHDWQSEVGVQSYLHQIKPSVDKEILSTGGCLSKVLAIGNFRTLYFALAIMCFKLPFSDT